MRCSPQSCSLLDSRFLNRPFLSPLFLKAKRGSIHSHSHWTAEELFSRKEENCAARAVFSLLCDDGDICVTEPTQLQSKASKIRLRSHFGSSVISTLRSSSGAHLRAPCASARNARVTKQGGQGKPNPWAVARLNHPRVASVCAVRVPVLSITTSHSRTRSEQ